MSTFPNLINPPKPKIKASQFNNWVKQNAETRRAMDMFSNVPARTGWGTPSLLESSAYPIVRLTYLYWLLMSLYRNHWLVRKVVDAVAEDMIKNWIKPVTEMTPQALSRFTNTIDATQTQNKLLMTMKWGRLFGGAGAVIVIDGDEDRLNEPLDPENVMPGTYKGLIPFDRWSGISPNAEINTDINDPIGYGLPKSYKVVTEQAESFDVDASRIIRFIGPDLPNWEKQAEQRWGLSVVEVFYEELRKRDNTSWNIAMLVFRANLIGYKQENLSQMLSGLGASQLNQQRWLAAMTALNETMSNQGMLIMGKNDELSNHQYSFGGLADVYMHIKEDICAATGYPYSRLFGKPSGGLGTTNEGDEHTYYDNITQKQKSELDPQLRRLLPVVAMSTWGKIPKDFTWMYNPVRSLGDKERSDLAKATVDSAVAVFNTGAISQRTFLQEIAEQSDTTGFGTNITPEVIEKADDTVLAPMDELALGGAPPPEAGAPEPKPAPKKKEAKDAVLIDEDWNADREVQFQGLRVKIENEVGSLRRGKDWEVRMTWPYGYILGTEGVDGDRVDCFLGPNQFSPTVYIVHTKNPKTGAYDEDKVLLGWEYMDDAKQAFLENYTDPACFGSIDILPMTRLYSKLRELRGRKITGDQRGL
jgi:phage-related protein (TIGR01555 family)